MNEAAALRERIQDSGLSIYDPIEVGDPDLWATAEVLEELLRQDLVGRSFAGLPIRTRSKEVKSRVCAALGYPVPRAFKRTEPRFPGQALDVYAQQSNNLQVWNQEISPTRRYAIVTLSAEAVVENVHVLAGERLAEYDTTGTLTSKYQARLAPQDESCLLSTSDTANFPLLQGVRERPAKFLTSPASYPNAKSLLPIEAVYERLLGLTGSTVEHVGMTQERNRGSEVHRLACEALGYGTYRDHGQFPDIRHQLVEVKLQTSPTIDLGLVLPSSPERLDLPPLRGRHLRHCDVRYAIFTGVVVGESVRIEHILMATGEEFFEHFTQFGGMEINKKLQIRLPDELWDRNLEGG